MARYFNVIGADPQGRFGESPDLSLPASHHRISTVPSSFTHGGSARAVGKGKAWGCAWATWFRELLFAVGHVVVVATGLALFGLGNEPHEPGWRALLRDGRREGAQAGYTWLQQPAGVTVTGHPSLVDFCRRASSRPRASTTT